MISTRLFLDRFAGTCGKSGLYLEKPDAEKRSGLIFASSIKYLTTLDALALESSQFEGNFRVFIGTSSVWPSTRTM